MHSKFGKKSSVQMRSFYNTEQSPMMLKEMFHSGFEVIIIGEFADCKGEDYEIVLRSVSDSSTS